MANDEASRSNKTSSSLYKMTVFNGLADVMPLAIGFVASIVLTRVLGPENWGVYGQITWLTGFLALVCSLGLTYTTIRYLSFHSFDAIEQRRLLFWLILVQVLLALIGTLLVFFFSSKIVSILGWSINARLLRVASIGILAFIVLEAGRSALRGVKDFQALAISSALLGVVIAVSIILTFLWPSVETLIISMALGQLLVVPWIYLRTWRNLRLSDTDISGERRWQVPTMWREVSKYTLVLFFTVIVDQIIWQRSEVFFLAKLPDAKETAYYSLAYTLARITISTIPLALAGILTPVFSSTLGESNNDKRKLERVYSRSITWILLIVLPIASGLFVISGKLTLVLYGEDFSPVGGLLRIMVFSTTIAVIARPGASAMHALNKPKYLTVGSLAALPVNILLALLLIPQLGATGAALANLAAYAVAGSSAILIVSITLHVRYDWAAIGKAAIAAGSSALAAWIMVQAFTVVFSSLIVTMLAVVVGVVVYPLVLHFLGEKNYISARDEVSELLSTRASFFRHLGVGAK